MVGLMYPPKNRFLFQSTSSRAWGPYIGIEELEVCRVFFYLYKVTSNERMYFTICSCMVLNLHRVGTPLLAVAWSLIYIELGLLSLQLHGP